MPTGMFSICPFPKIVDMKKIQNSGSESYLIQYAREKLGYVRPDEIKFDIDGNK